MGQSTSINKFPVVTPYTLKGKTLVLLLKVIYKLVGIFNSKKWRAPIHGFEENPAFFKLKDIIYLGYKYYIHPPTEFETDVVAYFKNQDLSFSLPVHFELESEITISAGGDLMPYARINDKNCAHLWDDVGSWFFGSDIVFANLETPIHLKEKPSAVPEIMLVNMLFNGSEELFDIFSGSKLYKGYDIVSTANNHSLDMGIEGINSTIDFLEKNGVAFTGTARNEEERNKIAMIEKKGIKVAFIAYTYSLNNLELNSNESYFVNHIRLNTVNPDLQPIKSDVIKAHQQGADIIILSLHTGNAYQSYPSKHTIENYHAIFEECGADIILGSHPHNPQPMEKYVFNCPITKLQKQGFAIYSLADFIAYDIFVWDRLIPLLKLTISKGSVNGKKYCQLSKVELLPVYNWGNRKGGEIRLFDLKRLISNGFPDYFTKKCRAEAKYLNEYCDTFLVKEKQRIVLKSEHNY